ncbi:hypothetical protein NE857_21640 [Nocardiopsis exhalans]|uniref:DUF6545 domain-containing protein n=1 Tax=Nocardiopsis exhalans TaxID=163604 RepID=A0ABY5D497_9ACTN|nr:DUF6545 domain-containing protein [Nocardiopsis exhalans]USY17921.1 hypothetical protein NE857_21640 [Nocardiopsis exhalans]
MTSVIVLTCTFSLVLVVHLIHRRPGRPGRLLRCGSDMLLAAIVLREIDAFEAWLAADLIMRLLLIGLQHVAVLLVLSFRDASSENCGPWLVYTCAALAGLSQIALYFSLPEPVDIAIHGFPEHGGDAVTVVYHGLYLVTMIAAAIITLHACARVALSSRHPIMARLALGVVGCGIVVACAFAVLSCAHLFDREIDNDTLVRDWLYRLSVVIILAGFVLGGTHKGLSRLRHKVLGRLADEVVGPLWVQVTTLHPDVVLPLPCDRHADPRARLTRLIIETNDGLGLIRKDEDEALSAIHTRHPEDPRLSAALLLHLTGAAPPEPVKLSTRAMLRLVPPADPMLKDAVIELCAIRDSLDTSSEWLAA